MALRNLVKNFSPRVPVARQPTAEERQELIINLYSTDEAFWADHDAKGFIASAVITVWDAAIKVKNFDGRLMMVCLPHGFGYFVWHVKAGIVELDEEGFATFVSQ